MLGEVETLAAACGRSGRISTSGNIVRVLALVSEAALSLSAEEAADLTAGVGVGS